jgi:hypothetical protein
MFRDIKAKITAAVKCYPLKKRAIKALSNCVLLLVVTITWRFEPAKTIAICAYTIGWLFDLRGKWSMLFFGIGIGDLLLYATMSALAPK